MTSGRVTFRWPDREETYGEGRRLVAPPAHLPLIAARTGVVESSPTADLPVVRQVIAAITAGEPT